MFIRPCTRYIQARCFNLPWRSNLHNRSRHQAEESSKQACQARDTPSPNSLMCMSSFYHPHRLRFNKLLPYLLRSKLGLMDRQKEETLMKCFRISECSCSMFFSRVIWKKKPLVHAPTTWDSLPMSQSFCFSMLYVNLEHQS